MGMYNYSRHKARRLLLQAVYQWSINPCKAEEIDFQFCQKANPKKVDLEYFSRLIFKIIGNIKLIDENIEKFSNRTADYINYVELSVLRVSVCELLFCFDIPYKVVINEALSLVKTFGVEDSFKYINGVLDKVAQSIRKEEINAK